MTLNTIYIYPHNAKKYKEYEIWHDGKLLYTTISKKEADWYIEEGKKYYDTWVKKHKNL